MRPRAPRYDSLSFDNLLAASHAGEPANAPVLEDDRPPAPVTYLPGVQPPTSEQPEPYRPVPAPESEQQASSAPQQITMSSQAVLTAPDGHPLTRRELRAMQQAQAANDAVQTDEQASGPVPNAPAAAVETPETVVVPSAPAVAPKVVAPSEPSQKATPAPSFAELLDGSAPGVAQTQPEAPTRRVIPPAQSVQQTSAQQAAVQQTPISTVPVQSTPTQAAPAAAAVAAEPSGPTTDPQLLARSAGHWSTMGDEPASDTGNTPRSSVASGSVTTANALILPSIPSAGMATTPLTSTGEIIVTGSIDLPRSLGTTGQHPDHFDSSDIDRIFEESDAAPTTSSVAPVRASKAVATHTSTRGMITPPKARGNKLPVTLAVTAAFLALGVAALLVAGYVFHAF
ncbi:hypothetical protein GCM10027568_10300 [Humibacter soli]